MEQLVKTATREQIAEGAHYSRRMRLLGCPDLRLDVPSMLLNGTFPDWMRLQQYLADKTPGQREALAARCEAHARARGTDWASRAAASRQAEPV